MVIDTIRKLRFSFSLLVLIVMPLAAFGPIGARSTANEAEPVCEYDDGSKEWVCAPGPHVYMDSCEGVDCYSAMEFCCIII